MSRKTKIITIEAGRDAGKVFEVTEPDAFTAEAKFMKLMALRDSGSLNMQTALNSTAEGTALWNSLLDHVKILPSGNTEISRKIDKEDIEDLGTLIKLKSEALSMLTDFTTE